MRPPSAATNPEPTPPPASICTTEGRSRAAVSASGSSLGGIAAAASSGAPGPPAAASGASSAPRWLPVASIPVPTRAKAPTRRAVPTTSRRRGRLEARAVGHRRCAAPTACGRECGCGGGPDEGWGWRKVAPALVLTLVAGEGIVHVSGPPDRVRSHAGRTDAGPASDPEARKWAITWAFGRCKRRPKESVRRPRPPSTAGRPSLGARPPGPPPHPPVGPAATRRSLRRAPGPRPR